MIQIHSPRPIFLTTDKRGIIAQELTDDSERRVTARIFQSSSSRTLMGALTVHAVLRKSPITPCTRRVPHFGVFAVFLHFVVSQNQ